MTKKLNELLANHLEVPKQFADIKIMDMTQDSRNVVPDSIFFACKGEQQDGRQFISQAIQKGACAIIADAIDFPAEIEQNIPKNIPLFKIEHLQQQHLSDIANIFFDYPSKNLTLYGVTGTNGKSSIAYLISAIGNMLGIKTGLIGTLGYGMINGHTSALKKTIHTTPDAIELQRMLAELKTQGCEWVALEVSSHALEQGRVSHLTFDTAIFTNLTRDHLDYHQTMAAYGQAKAKLFDFASLKYSIINTDDEFGLELINRINGKHQVIGYSGLGRIKELNIPFIRVQQSHFNQQGITASVISPWGSGLMQCNFMGRFYLNNLLAVVASLALKDIPFDAIISAIAKAPKIPGRMEKHGGENNQPLVIVDFAHTPDALKQVLLALQDHTSGEIWCVFGCGGDRDPGKRPIMGSVAELYADHLILTNDNPRTEDPAEIVKNVIKGIEKPERVVIEYERYRAIEHAIKAAKSEDVVVVAGKGHENYQIIGAETKSFSDAVAVQMILSELQ